MKKQLWQANRLFNASASAAAPLTDLIIRLFVAEFFFMAGLTKLSNWEQTVLLFEHEYQVPLLTAEIAAFLGTVTEIALPILLLLGLAGRFSAFGLFIFNVVAVISYEFLWTEAGTVGFMQHVYYGVLLLVPMTHGPGWISVDTLLGKWCDRCCKQKES